MENEINITAQYRWKLLRKYLLNQSQHGEIDKLKHSIRRFNSFNLFKVTRNSKDDSENWTYENLNCSIKIQKNQHTITHQDITAFNNTGNICIWGSEEVMAYYCLENLELFNNKKICELGGGFSNLTGLYLSKLCANSKILLSDGNEKSVDNVKDLVSANKCNAEAQVIRFDDQSTYEAHCGEFDIILCADCLFFDNYRISLVDVIYDLLKTEGLAIIFAPKRGKTLDDFVKFAKEKFGQESLSVDYYYNEIVWKKHCEALNKKEYNENIHYPILIKIIKL